MWAHFELVSGDALLFSPSDFGARSTVTGEWLTGRSSLIDAEDWEWPSWPEKIVQGGYVDGLLLFEAPLGHQAVLVYDCRATGARSTSP